MYIVCFQAVDTIVIYKMILVKHGVGNGYTMELDENLNQFGKSHKSD